MVTFPNAKINIGLNIIEKRSDGYHNLETLFYPIALNDVLEITLRDTDKIENYSLTVFNSLLNGNIDDNLVIKAYKRLALDYSLPKLDFFLQKEIPTGAGLGGGSADAAFALKMINEIANLSISENKLKTYAACIGADCAFFVRNKPAFATGIGDILTETEYFLSGYYLVLVKPEIHISTKDAYAWVVPSKPKISIFDIIKLPPNKWSELLENDFEKSVFIKYPYMKEIKNKLYSLGAVYASMSGSGSSFYGIFEMKPNESIIENHFSDSFHRIIKLQ